MGDDSARQVTFLANASDRTLQQYELDQRARASNLLRESRGLFFEAVEALAAAEAARFLRDHRGELTARTTEGVYLSFPSTKK